jgi:threonine dehydrogenase-like Zn-dependent dehydrogenase
MFSTALWMVARNRVEMRTAPLSAPAFDEVQVKMLYSGLSRGTEKLVLNGLLMTPEREFMRCPHMEGDFPFPVKYGYCAVGEVVSSSPLKGKAVFALHPHQDVFNVKREALTLLPDTLPPKRAILLANMETALNAVWDGGVTMGQKIVIVGGGVLGLLIGFLCAKITQTWLIDIDPSRKLLAESLGMRFQKPLDSPDNADVVFHTSATSAGLACALASAGFEAKIIELSWYGDNEPTVPLGAAFHPKRLQLISSQVGSISPLMRPRFTYARRLAEAMALLQDERLDALISQEIDFAGLEKTYATLLENKAILTAAIKY